MASRIINMTIPEVLIEQADKVAETEGRTRSELFREAVRQYVAEHSLTRPRKKGKKHGLMALRGLGKEIWRNEKTQDYVDKLRGEWT